MSTKYWIGRNGWVGDIKRWSDSPGVSLTLNRTGTLVTYSGLTGTLANGMTLYGPGINTTTPVFADNLSSIPLGVIGTLDTTNQTFYLTIGGTLQSGTLTNVNVCGGTITSTAPDSSSTVIFNSTSGFSTSIVYFKSAYTNTTTDSQGFSTANFTGFLGKAVASPRFTNLVLGKDMKFGNYGGPCYIGVFGTLSMEPGTPTITFSGVPILINAGYYYIGGVSQFSASPSTTVTLTSDIILPANSLAGMYFEAGTFTTNNYNIACPLVILGASVTVPTGNLIFNGGTSTITTPNWATVDMSTTGYTLTLNGNYTVVVDAGTLAGSFDNSNNNSYYSLVFKGTTFPIDCTAATTTASYNFTFDNAYLDSSVAGTQYTLTKLGGGTVVSTNSIFKDTYVTPVNTFFANNSKNLGNNQNIIFSSGSFMAFF